MSSTVVIAATGLCCPLGLGAGSAHAAIRAGIDRFRESSYLDDRREPIVCSSLSILPAYLGRGERLARLLAPAVVDATRGYTKAQVARMPLFLGTAGPGRPGTPRSVGASLRERLAEDHDLPLSERVHTITTGSTAGLHALAEARECLSREPEVAACIVASGDSLVNASALGWLEAQSRLKRTGNADGVIPGEAAACVVLARDSAACMRPAARLLGLGFADETATLTSDEPIRGHGLTRAAGTALREAGLELADIDARVADASGESYAFKELSLLLGRMLRNRHAPIPLHLPAENLGDTGAAAGLVALTLGAAAMTAPRSSIHRVLILASDVDGDRAAAVLARPDTERLPGR